jgi:hypothetical protein
MKCKLKLIDPAGVTVHENDHDIPLYIPNSNDRVQFRNLLEIGKNEYWIDYNGEFSPAMRNVLSNDNKDRILKLWEKKKRTLEKGFL